MAGETKMTNLAVVETSGVDHPAHLHEGWVVMKGTDPAEAEKILEALKNQGEHVSDTDKPTLESVTAELETLKAADAAKAAEIATLKADLAKAATPAEDGEQDPILKALPENVRELFKAERAKTEAAAAELRKERDERMLEGQVTKAKGYSHLGVAADELGATLHKLHSIDGDLYKAVDGVLAAAEAKLASSAIMEIQGKRPGTGDGSAFSRANAMAKSLHDSDPDGFPTMAQARAHVYATNPDLAEQVRTEQKG